MNEQIGKRIGDYEILGVLGAGGMGQVFKVRNVISDRVEAMKVLLPDLAGRQDLANRFLREIKVLASLNHPNIAYLRTALTLDNQLVMVMEYVEGVTLSALVEQGPLPIPEALNYIDQVLSALSYAHKQNVIHRDIKPANMMLTRDGVVKLMDFGIARSGSDRTLTATGTTLGSLHYMSPEQVKGGNTDARSDLYSVGISLYELITGKPPFHADSDYSLMAAQLQQQPTPPIEMRPDLPAPLNEIILTAMEKDPDKRFQTADAFRNAISNVASTLPKPTVAPVIPAGRPAASAATELFQGTLPTASAPRISPATLQSPSSPLPSQTPPPTASAQHISAQPPAPQPVSVPPQAAPVPQAPVAASTRSGGHRGLYMSLGALIVLGVLVLAGLYIPRHSSTRAHESSNDQTQPAVMPQSDQNQGNASTAGQTQPASTPDSTGSTSPASPAQPPVTSSEAGANRGASSTAAVPSPSASTPNLAGKPKHAKSALASQESSGGVVANPATPMSQSTQSASQPTETADTAQLQELEQQMDQISSRADSVNESLNTLKAQQSAQGFGLRGDIASTQQLMKSNLAKAQVALQNQDAKNAKKYLDLAEPQVETLEKFLGH